MEQRLHAHDEANGWSYAKFVRGNPTGARTIENLLQYAGFFAPVSFKTLLLLLRLLSLAWRLALSRWVQRSFCGAVLAADS